MKRCEKCNIAVADPKTRCPLCGGMLSEGDGSEVETFPSIPTRYKQYSLYFRLLILISVGIGIVSVMLNLLLPQSGLWSLIVVGSLLCLWLLLSTAMRKTNNISKNILWQSILLSFLLVGWDLFTGWHRWSVNFVLPALYVAAMLGISIVSRAMRLKAEDYIIYLLVDILFGLIPLIFFLTGLAEIGWLCLLSVIVSVLSLTSVFLFSEINLWQELKKRFHL